LNCDLDLHHYCLNNLLVISADMARLKLKCVYIQCGKLQFHIACHYNILTESRDSCSVGPRVDSGPGLRFGTVLKQGTTAPSRFIIHSHLRLYIIVVK
jgi:hypothetical protein